MVKQFAFEFVMEHEIDSWNNCVDIQVCILATFLPLWVCIPALVLIKCFTKNSDPKVVGICLRGMCDCVCGFLLWGHRLSGFLPRRACMYFHPSESRKWWCFGSTLSSLFGWAEWRGFISLLSSTGAHNTQTGLAHFLCHSIPRPPQTTVLTFVCLFVPPAICR